VRGETRSEEARERYRRGTALYNIGKYLEAAREYEAAYEETSDPPLLFNIGQAYRLAGERRKALTTYRSYLRTAPDGEKRTLAQGFIRDLEALLAAETPATANAPTPEPPAPAPTPATSAQAATPPPPVAARQDEPTPAPALRHEAVERPRSSGRGWLWIGGAALLVGIAAAVFFVASGAAGPEEPATDLGTMRF
jgi:tetratricopeptide (TPR) repeat protein